MLLPLNSVVSKYTANIVPNAMEICPLSKTSAILPLKNCAEVLQQNGRKQITSCSCLRSNNPIRLSRWQGRFKVKNEVCKPFPVVPSTHKIWEKCLCTVVKFQGEGHRWAEVMSPFASERLTLFVILNYIFLTKQPLLLESIGPWVLVGKRAVN